MKKEPILYIADQTHTRGFNTGIQRVVRKLAKALIENGENVIPVDFVNEKFELVSLEKMKMLAKFDGPKVNSWGLGLDRESMSKAIYTSTRLLFPELPDCYVQPYQLSELISHCKQNNIKTGFVFHDAIPIVLRDLYKDTSVVLDGPGRHLEYMKNLNYADYIFPVSYNSEKDYIKTVLFYGGKPGNNIFSYSHYATIKTVPLPTEIDGVPSMPAKKIDPKDIHISYISSFDKRKNHEFLYNAFSIMLKKLKDKKINVTLHVSGTAYDESQKLATDWWAKRLPIVVNYNCDDKTIIDTYKISDFTVYPSLYEGFGLPIVESLATNTPVLCSNGGSLKELAIGGGCVTFDIPEDSQNFQVLASEMYDLVTSPNKIKALQEEISGRTVRTWSQYASDLVEALV